jgi:phosphoglycolate phosphatase-like HAD superfamily hydrolase
MSFRVLHLCLGLLFCLEVLVSHPATARSTRHPVLSRDKGSLPTVHRTPNSGLQLCKSVLRQKSKQNNRGKWCVIFDIDNTLVDTRHRTHAAARAFANKHPSGSSLASIPFGKVRYNGKQTGKCLGLSSSMTRAFQRHWNRFFWDPVNFKHDRPIRQTVQLARQAKATGAEVFYLTGRIEPLKTATLSQLRQLGLPDADEAHLMCKPGLKVATAPFKQQTVQNMLAKGHDIGWFMSDSRKDIASVQQTTPISCVWVDFPVKPSGPPVGIKKNTDTIRLR